MPDTSLDALRAVEIIKRIITANRQREDVLNALPSTREAVCFDVPKGELEAALRGEVPFWLERWEEKHGDKARV